MAYTRVLFIYPSSLAFGIPHVLEEGFEKTREKACQSGTLSLRDLHFTAFSMGDGAYFFRIGIFMPFTVFGIKKFDILSTPYTFRALTYSFESE